MRRTLLVVVGLALTVLLGRYVIPSTNSGAPQDRPTRAETPVSKVISRNGPSSSSALETGQPVSSKPSAMPIADSDEEATPAAKPSVGTPAETRSGVFVNGRELTSEQMTNIAAVYHYLPPRGRYWYDSMSGAWGVEGREAAGFLQPGHDFGPLAANASAGNTGVFINGRELNTTEAMTIQRSLGAVYQGHWWLDGRTGNFGVQGNPMPQGNLIALLRSQQSQAKGGDNFWCSRTACGNDDGHTGYINVDGTTVVYDH